jgi:DNA-binding protein
MAKESRADDNVIYVGSKPMMNYVLAVVTQFNDGSTEVVIKARGRAISRAVDTAEVTRNKFLRDVKVKEIKIGTERLEGRSGEKMDVSSMEIFLSK